MSFGHQLWTRLGWAMRSAQGWRLEGPYPRRGAEVMLICGPSLPPDTEWERYLILHLEKRQHRGQTDTANPIPKIRCATTLDMVSRHIEEARHLGLDIQLVQRSCRHRKIRCNTPFNAQHDADRTTDYVRRIFSYPMGCEDVTTA